MNVTPVPDEIGTALLDARKPRNFWGDTKATPRGWTLVTENIDGNLDAYPAPAPFTGLIYERPRVGHYTYQTVNFTSGQFTTSLSSSTSAIVKIAAGSCVQIPPGSTLVIKNNTISIDTTPGKPGT